MLLRTMTVCLTLWRRTWILCSLTTFKIVAAIATGAGAAVVVAMVEVIMMIMMVERVGSVSTWRTSCLSVSTAPLPVVVALVVVARTGEVRILCWYIQAVTFPNTTLLLVLILCRSYYYYQ